MQYDFVYWFVVGWLVGLLANQLTNQLHLRHCQRQSVGHSGWAFEDAEVLGCDVGQVGVVNDVIKQLGPQVGFHRGLVFPGVDAAIGIGRGVGEPDFGKETGHGSKGGGQLVTEGAIVGFAGAFQIEINDLNVHDQNPF